jgi:hypothetical protein
MVSTMGKIFPDAVLFRKPKNISGMSRGEGVD